LTGEWECIMEENRYSKWDLFQSILLFVISYFFSFLEHAKQVFIYLLHLDDNHEKLEIIYPPLKVTHAYPHCITDFDKSFIVGPCDDHDQVNKPHKAKADVSSLVPSPASSRAQHRYRPLNLPHILHDFPPKHYEYLPMFDGELDTISTENHIHGFDHFIYLFEIDHDDVCMRAFS
jgi:hypothetical protein